MEEKHSTTLYFYPSKVKNILFIIMGIVFVVSGVAVCFIAFKDEEYVMSIIGAGMAIFFIWLLFTLIKRLITAAPYLILTEEELMINPYTEKSIPIKWEDIEGYSIKHVQFNKFIEIILYDEEKYKEQMSNIQQKLNTVGTMGGKFSSFAIAWTQIKRKDRDILLYALDYIDTPDFDLENATASEWMDSPASSSNTSSQLANQITKKYFLKSYLGSLILAVFAMFLFYWDEGDFSSLTYIIVSFILFPFAKLIFDVIIGFKLKEIIDNQTFVTHYAYQLIYIVYLLLFI